MKFSHLFFFCVFLFLSALNKNIVAQVSGEVAYKRIFDLGEGMYYYDTLRFNGRELLYIEKHESRRWKTRHGFDFKLAEKDQAWYLSLDPLLAVEQQYNPDRREYELRQSDVEPLPWEIHDEFKTIGKYRARKATVDHPDPSLGLATAWFTTEIPVSGGPHRLWGLPGLILECSVKGAIKGKYIMESVQLKPVGELLPGEGEWAKGNTNAARTNKRTLRDLLNKDG